MSKQVLKVLHLDDEQIYRSEVKSLLEVTNDHCTFIVTSFSDPNEMLRFIKSTRQRFDLYLIDYELPNTNWNGYSVCSELKNIRPEATTFILSSFYPSSVPIGFDPDNIDDYLSKKSLIEPEFPKLVYSAYLAALERKQSGNKTFLKHIDPVAGNKMQVQLERIPGILESAIDRLVVSGDAGTGKTFFCNQFKKIAALYEFKIIEFQHSQSFTKSLARTRAEMKKGIPSWVILEHIDEYDLNQQRKIASLLKYASKKVRFLLSYSEKRSIISSLQKELGQHEVRLTPLRERPEEIPDFCDFFRKRLVGGPYQIESAALDVLKKHSYFYRNVDELYSTLKAMTEFKSGNTLTLGSIPSPLIPNKENRNHNQKRYSLDYLSIPYSLDIEDLEYYYAQTLAALLRNLGEKYQVVDQGMSLKDLAPKLGITRQTLSKKIKDLVERGIFTKTEGALWYGKDLSE